MKFVLPFLIALSASPQASAFSPRPLGLNLSRGQVESLQSSSRGPSLAALPTIEEVSTGDFMKQLGFASQVVPLLHPEGDAEISDEESVQLSELLAGLFSHPDGVRGFFACYFTFLVTSSDSGSRDVPDALAEALKSADGKVLVPLVCNNVIMPTAMMTVHTDDSLISLSKKTANNGKKMLTVLKGDEDVISNCQAIMSVCNNSEEGSEDLIKHWKEFFENSKFAEKQKEAIAEAVAEFC